MRKFSIATYLCITAWGVLAGCAALPPVAFQMLRATSTPESVEAVILQDPREFDCRSVAEIPEAECRALVAIYEHTNGPAWQPQNGVAWLRTNHPCHWAGIACVDGHISMLIMNGFKLAGKLPPEIENLRHLTTISLSMTPFDAVPNYITALPEEIGNLTNLTYLDLSGNQLNEVPDTIGNLSNLTTLSLSRNPLAEIPATIGNLSQLEDLSLQGIQLTQVPDTIGNLSTLKTLDLVDNQLSEVPDTIGDLSHLRALYLNVNQLTQVPDTIGNLSHLEELGLGPNQLTQVPDTLANLSNLKILQLNNNRLVQLPHEITNLHPVWLDVASNCLGALTDPDVIAWLDALQSDWRETQHSRCTNSYREEGKRLASR